MIIGPFIDEKSAHGCKQVFNDNGYDCKVEELKQETRCHKPGFYVFSYSAITTLKAFNLAKSFESLLDKTAGIYDAVAFDR